MKDKKFAGIISLIFMVALTAFAIWGSDFLANLGADEAVAMDVNGAEGVVEASKTVDKDGNATGYVVVTTAKGYAGDIKMTITFEADGTTIKEFVVDENKETPGLGAKIAEAEFTSSLQGIKAPVYLAGKEGEGTAIDGVSNATYSSTAVVDGINYANAFLAANK